MTTFFLNLTRRLDEGVTHPDEGQCPIQEHQYYHTKPVFPATSFPAERFLFQFQQDGNT